MKVIPFSRKIHHEISQSEQLDTLKNRILASLKENSVLHSDLGGARDYCYPDFAKPS
jgi:hypothetical protein